MSGIKDLIICNPYKEPTQHWKYDRNKKEFQRPPGRRPAGFLIASKDSKEYDDPGEFTELKLVNKIRIKVDDWRAKNYPGITGITRHLLTFWHDDHTRENPFFFCQLEAIETLIWLTESVDSERQGIQIPSDGSLFQRLCCKMATGTGKTLVMAMVIAWQVINKVTYPKNTKFSKNILIMAPGLTVKSRLQVLHPTNESNFYDQFSIVPESMYEKLSQGKIKIHNWHTLMPESDPHKIIKRGSESDLAFSRRILDHNLKNIIVINDEAHHAYRASAEQTNHISPSDLARDKRWVEGLDKIHNDRTILKCFDFSATPFIPHGKNASEDTLFDWIVSDFSLNDAIESGLTKTPRISIRDDSNTYSKEEKSRFYHIYKDDKVRPDLNKNANEREKLPDLVTNAYMLLGKDWLETKKLWDKKGSDIPPVMITVCNKTHTAARIMYSFVNKRLGYDELATPECLLRIDSTTIRKAEDGTGDAKSESLREKVDTVGKPGKSGEQIKNIIAVQMLSEGWDARNVTHIMGLRAFSSQLLCEQVVGRGLRRTTYEINPDTGLFSNEYVNVFGVPFTFLPHEGGKDTPPMPPTSPPITIEPDPEKIKHMISWPNIDRINYDYNPKLSINWKKITSIDLQSDGISTVVGMAPTLDGKPHVDKLSEIDLCGTNETPRLQKIIFIAAKDVYDDISLNWKGHKALLLIQIINFVEKFINMGKINVAGESHNSLKAKMTILLHIKKVVSHVCKSIEADNITRRWLELNDIKPIKSTTDMRPWATKKPTGDQTKSHINLAVYDSGWEEDAGRELERNENVISWAKNDHLGFVIKYMYDGSIHDYWPDFLIRLKNNVTLVLEIKGIDDDKNREKRKYLEEWVDVVNKNGNYGAWAWDVVFDPMDVKRTIQKHIRAKTTSNEHAKCPKCGKHSHTLPEINKEFGFRNVNGITRSQSWCRRCRTTAK